MQSKASITSSLGASTILPFFATHLPNKSSKRQTAGANTVRLVLACCGRAAGKPLPLELDPAELPRAPEEAPAGTSPYSGSLKLWKLPDASTSAPDTLWPSDCPVSSKCIMFLFCNSRDTQRNLHNNAIA